MPDGSWNCCCSVSQNSSFLLSTNKISRLSNAVQAWTGWIQLRETVASGTRGQRRHVFASSKYFSIQSTQFATREESAERQLFVELRWAIQEPLWENSSIEIVHAYHSRVLEFVVPPNFKPFSSLPNVSSDSHSIVPSSPLNCNRLHSAFMKLFKFLHLDCARQMIAAFSSFVFRFREAIKWLLHEKIAGGWLNQVDWVIMMWTLRSELSAE